MLAAYKNNPKLREDFIAEMKWHQEQDKVAQGFYAEGSNGDFRGCHIGCAVHSLARLKGQKLNTANHQLLEEYLDIPVELAYAFDGIFESLPIEKARLFPLQCSEAIRVGADLKMIVPQFIFWMLQDAPRPKDEPAVVTEYVDAVTAIYKHWTETGEKPAKDGDLADRAYRADRADLADLAYRADRAYRAYRAYLADRADLAERSAEKLIELLKAA